VLPLVQVPPRGVWGKGGRATCTTAEAWLGEPLESNDTTPDALLPRYLAAFGPATSSDMRTWSGVTGLREAAARLRPQLRVFRDEHGRELLDLSDAPRPHPDTLVPTRFLPGYDNVFLSHSDRTRIVVEEHPTRSGIGPGSVLLDGFVRAAWKITRVRGAATLQIEPFMRLSTAERTALTEEGARLLAFVAPGADMSEIQLIANA